MLVEIVQNSARTGIMSSNQMANMVALRTKKSAEDQSRTDDTRIFSPLLYHLSYLGRVKNLSHVDDLVNG